MQQPVEFNNLISRMVQRSLEWLSLYQAQVCCRIGEIRYFQIQQSKSVELMIFFSLEKKAKQTGAEKVAVICKMQIKFLIDLKSNGGHCGVWPKR